MDKRPGKRLNKRLFVSLIICLALAGILVWRLGAGPVLGADEKSSASKEQVSAGPVKDVLKSQLAGSWYPADASQLRAQIGEFFQNAEVEPIDNVIALILPHAGYRYSGQTAAFALKTVGSVYERVVIIGPSHRARMEEMLSVPRVTHYETPLGQIPLDTEFIEKLLKFPMFQNFPYAHQHEHSVQIELPLVQFRQKNFRLVPIVAGDCSPKTVRKVGEILKGLVDERTLVIASSDFVHYGPRYTYVPFKENVAEQIKKLDMGAYEYIAKLDADGFLGYKKKTGATICGSVPIAILLSMLDKSTKANLVKYATSGELTGDFTNSVSYLAVAFAGTWQKSLEVKPQRGDSQLTEQDKQRLLTLARKTLIYAFENRKVPEPSDLGVQISPVMARPRAAFVTLKKDSRLRGCIGDIYPQRPLYKSVITNAINAAFNDRRFSPLQKDECGDVNIELSVLTPPEPVGSPNEIRIGTDGMVIRKNGRSAVYLPQVAPEQGWNLAETLTHLSRKAGLEPDAWKSGASFLVFQADVFGEEK